MTQGNTIYKFSIKVSLKYTTKQIKATEKKEVIYLSKP